VRKAMRMMNVARILASIARGAVTVVVVFAIKPTSQESWMKKNRKIAFCKRKL